MTKQLWYGGTSDTRWQSS